MFSGPSSGQFVRIKAIYTLGASTKPSNLRARHPRLIREIPAHRDSNTSQCITTFYHRIAKTDIMSARTMNTSSALLRPHPVTLTASGLARGPKFCVAPANFINACPKQCGESWGLRTLGRFAKIFRSGLMMHGCTSSTYCSLGDANKCLSEDGEVLEGGC